MTTTPRGGSDLEATGERLVPELQHGELVHAEHLARYQLAARLAAGKRVLDAASGEGFGTAILAEAGAKAAVGVDVDERTVEHARERYGLDFRVADVSRLPFEEGSFDLVVSFETIEHVQDAEATLRELHRVLAPDGLLLISTPNKREYLVENEFHTREFTREEFVELLGRHFATVRPLYQHNWTTSAVLDGDAAGDSGGERRHALDLYKVGGIEPGRELYAVAICGGRGEVPLRPVAVAAGVDEAHRLAVRLAEAERVAAQWHDEYKKAEEVANDWHAQYEAVVSSLSWRLTAPLRRAGRLRRRRGR